jgi:hypothetical protein
LRLRDGHDTDRHGALTGRPRRARAGVARGGRELRQAPVKASLSSADPTVFRGAPSAEVRPSGKAAVSGLRVAVVRKRTTYASGGLSGTLPRGRRTVVRMRTRRSVAKGAYQVALSGKVNGCTARRTTTWKFGNPTLPVRATPASTLVGDNVTAVRLFLRGVGDQRTAQVDVVLLDAARATVAEAPATLQGGSAVVDLPLASPLQPGRYVLHLTGSAPGVPHAAPADQEIAFGPGGRGAPVAPQGTVAKASVDWSGGM